MQTAERLAEAQTACCSRCDGLTDAQLSRARRRPITVGRMGIGSDGRVVPMNLERLLTPRLEHLLVTLLDAYPRFAPWADLFPEGWADTKANRAAIRAAMGDLRWNISDLGVWIVAEYGRGYRLSETP